MRKFACCRNRLILLIFLLVCCRLHLASWLHNVPAWKTGYKDWFGVEAAKPTAPMPPSRTLFLISLERYRRLSCTLPVGHNPQKHHFADALRPIPKWSMAAAKVPHSRRCPIQQSPSMLSDCRMRWHWECGTMVAVGQQRPPWLVGLWLASCC